MPEKNDATIICPNCGTEMVRARFEIEDGWIRAWLCECDEAVEPKDAEMDDLGNALKEEVRYGTATLVTSAMSADEELKEENIPF